MEKLYSDITLLFNQLWYSDDENLKVADESLLNELYAVGLIKSETEISTASNNVNDGIFSKITARKLPIGYTPRTIEKIKTGKLIRLLPHNQEIYSKLLLNLADNRKGYIVQPTGTGKSYLIAKYIQDHIEDNIIMVAPNTIIINSVKDIIGKSPPHITFQTYQYLSRDLKRTKYIANGKKHILIDEFHHAGASTWGQAINELICNADNPFVIGFSATPERDNDDIDVASNFFDNNCIHSLSLFECWERKILPMPKLVQSFVEIDNILSDIENDLSYKLSNQPSKIVRLQKQIQEIKSKYIAETSMEKVIKDFIPTDTTHIIVFVPTIDCIQNQMDCLSQCFNRVGMTPTCFQVHSKQSSKENSSQLEEFKARNTGVNLMFSVDKLIEGIHIEDVDALILLRSTQSVRIALQQLGRCLSSGKKKTPIVLDLVNNYKAGNIFGMSISNGVCSDVTAEHIAKELNILGNYAEIKQAIADLYSKFNTWEDKFAELLRLKIALGRTPKASDNIGSLYQWWIGQKKEYRDCKMSAEHIQKFEENDFILDNWDYMFEQLKEFISENNRLPTQKDGKIGTWKNTQRQNYRDGILTSSHASKLLSIGIDLKIKQEWGEWYETLKKFIKDKHREPSSSAKDKSENRIYGWLNFQRREYKNGRLEEFKVTALEKLGISLGASSYELNMKKDLEDRINEIKEHLVKYGHLPKINENRALYLWINGQKQSMRDGSVNEKRLKLLKSVGIEIETVEEWKITYNRLKAFIDHNNRTPNKNDDNGLYTWLRKQLFALRKIKNGKSGLTQEQIILLNALKEYLPTKIFLKF